MHKKIGFILFGIIILAALLRFYHLGKTPISPDWDEASLGYNAYSILQTGRDEYAQFLPVVLRSFDDYKPALYAYLATPSIRVFGLNTFSVRLPSAVFGVLAVLATYFLVLELFDLQLTQHKFNKRVIALLTAFLLAISPWHLQFSRTAFESNIGLSLNIFGILFFLKALKKPYFFILSALFFSLSLYSYQSEKVFVPLMLILLLTLFGKQIKRISKKYFIIAFIIGFIISSPLLQFTLLNKQALARAQGVSVFANANDLLVSAPIRIAIDRQNHDVMGLLFDNRRTTYAKIIVGNYLSHFDPDFLFLKGDLALRHQAPQMGHLYLFDLPFLLIGLFALLFGPFDKKIKLFLLFWIFIVPIPAAVTFDVPNSVRTLNFLPTLQILIALGVLTAIAFVSRIKHHVLGIHLKKIIFAFSFLLILFNLVYFLDQYFVQQDYIQAQDWQYGYKNAVAEIQRVDRKYNTIVVSDKQPMDQSYIFFLYYLQYNPKAYQDNLRADHAFGKYEFKDFSKDGKKDGNSLYVGSASDFSKNIKALETVYNPDSTPAIKIVEGKQL